MFVKYIGIPELTVQTREGPITVITDEVIEVYNEDYNELRQRFPGDFIVEAHGSNPVGPIPISDVLIDATTALVNDQGNDATGAVGDAAKPFLTGAAALAAIPAFGTIRAENSVLTGNIGTAVSFFNLVLDDTEIVGNITAFFVYIRGTTAGPGVVTTPGNIGSAIIGNILAATLELSGLSAFTGNITGKAAASTCAFNIYDIGTMSTVGAALIGDGTSVYTGTINNVGRIITGSGAIVSDLLTNGGPNIDITISNVGLIQSVDVWTGLGSAGTLSLRNIASLKVDNGIYGGPTIAARILDLNNCYFANSGALGKVIDVSGIGTMTIRSYNSVYEVAVAEMIVWATDPAGVVTLLSSSLLNKPWNTTGVVTQIVNNDLINASITVL